MKKSVKITISLFIIGLFLFTFLPVSATTLSKNKKENSPEITNIGNKYALIVGTGLFSCPYTTYDALGIKKALVNNGWSSVNIKCLTGLLEATKSNILDGINWLDTHEKSNDIVLFFFSGHGTYGEIFGANIMEGIDTNIYTITSQDLDDAFSRLESETIVMVFDSCFSGSFTELINPLSKPGRIIISVCNAIELSSSSNELINGIFTYYFSNALDLREELTDADKNNDKQISAKETFNHAKRRTNFYLQYPQIYYGASADLVITKENKIKDKSYLDQNIQNNFLFFLINHFEKRR